jgi:SAM-dependent methyltransferase
MDYIVPDNFTLPTTNTICQCVHCGMIYYDNDRTQADYDEYYRTRYGYDGRLDPTAHIPRWEADIQAVCELEPNHNALIVDFGGGIGYIARRLREIGYTRAVSVEIGEPLPDNIDLMLSIHVLEHVYDLQGVVGNMIAHLSPTGRLLVEVPDAAEYGRYTDLPMIDYHQQHVNHFIGATLDRLFSGFDYHPVYRLQAQLPKLDAAMYRALYVPGAVEDIYHRDMERVRRMVAERLEKLKTVQGPVILWGCGPYAMHMLANAPDVAANVVEWIDNDPAYRGQTIMGKPVQDAPTCDAPILVIAQQQATGLLDRIKRGNYPNEVIQI